VGQQYDKEWQLATLRESVPIWNLWCAEHRDIPVDLSEANLHKANLRGANLSAVNLSGAKLSRADLRKPNGQV
jgi:uncharacterized protein YjbI with pentapeptide repeats